MDDIRESLSRVRLDTADDIAAYEQRGVKYADWHERWMWEGVKPTECFLRFSRLQPAINEARRRNETIWRRYTTSKSTISTLDDSAHKDTTSKNKTEQHEIETMIGRVVRVFSAERLSADRQYCVWSFIVADYISFWNVLSLKKCEDVQGNEIIEERHSCHLYFDLEFQRAYNKDLDGNRLVLILIKELERVLWKRWEKSLDDAFIMEMDATTSEKFSRHLIIRFRNQAFRDSSHVKAIVQEVIHTAPPGQFLVKKDNGTCSFIDEAVYSRNRSFRMLWCSKTGKNNQLKPTRRFSLRDFTTSGIQTTQRLFYLSLVSNVLSGVQLLEVDDVTYDIRNGSMFETITARKTIRQEGRFVEICQKSREDYGQCYYANRAECFIPIVEELVWRLSNLSATVKKVIMLGYDGMVSYNFSGPGAHFCALMGRPHKRNYVYYLVDLQSMHYQQRCYDYECDNTKAHWTPIPATLCARFADMVA